MEDEGVQTASNAENKRKREQTVKRKEEKERLLAKANVLVVIAEKSNFKFKMPLEHRRKKTCTRQTDVLEPRTKVDKKRDSLSVNQSRDNLG